MEVKVSNISRHATSDTIKSIFEPLGQILVLEHYQSTSKKDGSFEADIVYANLSEAALALKLCKTELGDRVFTVEPIMNRFRFNVAPERTAPKIACPSHEKDLRTLLIRGLNSDMKRVELEEFLRTITGEPPVLVGLYGKNIMRPAAELGIDFDSAMACVEFSSRPLMLRAVLALRACSPTVLGSIIAPNRVLVMDEAWKTIEPEVPRPDQIHRYALAAKLASSTSTGSVGPRDKERDRESGRERDRESGRVRDRESGRVRDRDSERHRDRDRDRGRDRDRDRGRDRDLDKHRNLDAHRDPDKHRNLDAHRDLDRRRDHPRPSRSKSRDRVSRRHRSHRSRSR